jgi:hypothetical protein
MSILVLTSDTLIGTPATGNIEYNGQFYGTDSNASRAQLQRITSGTAVASTSGTSIDFTSIPAWVKRITVMFSGVSTNGTSNIQVQLGAGSVATSGYLSNGSRIQGSSATTLGANTAGFTVASINAAADAQYGLAVFCNISGNIWVSNGILYATNYLAVQNSVGQVSLGGVLDRVRITTANGTDTFDAGSINIMYEG